MLLGGGGTLSQLDEALLDELVGCISDAERDAFDRNEGTNATKTTDIHESTYRPHSATNTVVGAVKRVQTSIAQFFRPPKANRTEEAVAVSIPVARLYRAESITAAARNTKNIPIKQAAPKPPYSKAMPAFKRIPGTSFAVDAFSYGAIPGVRCYFLTHYHSDHYQGLSGASFGNYPSECRLYCSPVTANLVRKYLNVPEDRIVQLEVGLMYGIEECAVGVLDANHCPGSVMFAFGLPAEDKCDVRRGISWLLHTGDFRAHCDILKQELRASSENAAHFMDGKCSILASELLFDRIYLDTTYADPRYVFPPQDLVIRGSVARVSELIRGARDPHGQSRLAPLQLLVAIGSYFIGKERLVLAVAEALDCPIYADSRKRACLNQLHWPALQSRLTDDPKATPVHLVPMAWCGRQRLGEYLEVQEGRFTHILGIRPTGWSFKQPGEEKGEDGEEGEGEIEECLGGSDPDKSSDFQLSIKWHDWHSSKHPRKQLKTIGVCGVPYSEHSSYAELTDFLRQAAFQRIFPTVDNWRSQEWELKTFGGDSDQLLAALSTTRK
jgi:DNA cross-link repair 1A protein